MKTLEELNEILKGINKDHCEDDSGWWETSGGAKFGARKLKEVQDLVKKHTIEDFMQKRKFLISFVKYTNERTDMWRENIAEHEIDLYLKNNNLLSNN